MIPVRVARLLSGVQIGVAALPVAIAGGAVTYLGIVRVTGALPASDAALLQSKLGSLHRKVSGEGRGLKR